MLFLEVFLFIGAVVGVIALGIWKSRDKEKKVGGSASDYFLAGRGLTWWLVGFSLIAANISTEQFVGMSGSAANWLGMAIASYEWMAALTLVVVAFWFLPKFLKAGLYTIPEFLEYRFDSVARLAMAIPAIVTMVFVATSSVIFSGAKFVSEYYNDVPVINSLTAMCWLIAAFAAVYVFIGGLKACAWTDLIWGVALVLGGVVVMVFAFNMLAEKPAEELILTKVHNSEATVQDLEGASGWERFMLLNDGVDGEAVAKNGPNGSGGKVHMIRPKEDSDIPWTALLIGLWIPNFFYWGLNQYIVQRTLGSKSLAEGQKGIVFAAFLKLIIPFVVVIPGILAYNLFSGDLLNPTTGEYDYDKAFPVLVRNLVRPTPWISWFVLAALCGAVISSLASMLNSASTIATMDLYAKFSGEKDPNKLVKVGRIFVILFVIMAAFTAPFLNDLGSIFSYIQEFQGFISPGLLAVFIFGFFSPRTPRYFGAVGIATNVVAYAAFKWLLGPWLVSNGWWYSDSMAFLDRMAICFFIVIVTGAILTVVSPLQQKVVMPENKEIALETSPIAKFWGGVVVAATIALYAVFW
ncbi:sodium/solute symporter [Pelagicoccus sp. SDUM812002]|uniref:sodium:solute symporter family transporter n=1 Tax=Pelagicoccus sp. SDUM812002 TaxID=3041266 RepID=UPI00280F1098|nr:sodium/solute symporter [Pelagicoccus sp. SDUM812002]MDQ8184972.1 sodium/solute symporter [Pelagicoccus sp. SDUM812002]